MTLGVVACTLLAFLGNSLLESAEAQRSNVGDSWNVIKSLESLAKAIQRLEAKVEVQADLLKNLTTEHQKQDNFWKNLEAEEEWQEASTEFMTNRTIVALKGDDVEIRCVADKTLLSQIKWKREKGMLALERVQYANHRKTLHIKNLDVTDSGTYVCDATDLAGTPLSHSIILEVYAQAQQCHTLMESDQGNLEIETLSTGCLLVIKLENTTGFRLELRPHTTEPILVIPEQTPSNSYYQSVGIYGSKNASHTFEGKILAIVVPPGRERTVLNWTGLGLDESGVTLSTEFKNDSEGTLKWEPKVEGTHKIFWAFEHEVTGHLSWTLNTTDLASNPELPCESISLAILEISLDGNVSEIEKSCEGSSIGYLMSERSSQVLILLHMKSLKEARSNLEVTWTHHGVTMENVTGVLAGTTGSGTFVIPFNSTQTRNVSSGNVYGLAFDWNSRRVYGSQNGVGIMRSNVDGSESRTLLSDSSSTLYGIAIEAISGNLYYGNRTSRTILVCNNDATKCSTIANSRDLSDMWDIAVHSSKGLLFWFVRDSRKLVRANLDGSNATVILQGLNVWGIDVDEPEDRLYWGGREVGIRGCDLNGQDIHTLPNVSTKVEDVAIDGDKVYYSTYDPEGIHVISKLGTSSSLVTTLTSRPYQIALFGTRVSNQPPNPCKKSQCAHLCVVMSPSSYQCMCPGTKALNEDGRTCQP